MSTESDIIKAGPNDPVTFARNYKRRQILEMDTDTAFHQEQSLKKEKIGDAATMVVMQAEERSDSGSPLSKKELANLCIDALAQVNFEKPDPVAGKMTDRGGTGSNFSLPEIEYYMALIEVATEGIPIAASGGRVNTNGVKPMSAERFRNIFEGSLRKLRKRIDGDPELKEVLPQYLKEKRLEEQRRGRPVSLSVPKIANFENLYDFLNRHS